MTALIHTCLDWSRSIASDEVCVLENRDMYDTEFGEFDEIQIIPTALSSAKISILVTNGKYLALHVECWERLSKRINANSPNDRQRNLVGAYQEFGGDLMVKANLIDAIIRGHIEIEARVYRGTLVGTAATIQLASKPVVLPGPALGRDMMKYVGMVDTLPLKYLRYAEELPLLADRI